MSDLSRRDFGRLAFLGAALTTNHAALFGANRNIGIGVQLYSVRKDAAADLRGVLAAIARMGYQAVEFAGYYNHDAKAVRKMLDDAGLKCCGSHIGLPALLGDELSKTVEFNRIIGNKYLVVPGLPKENRASRQAWIETASVFNEISAKVKPHGMRVGYHNHTIEFQPLDGEKPWDTFFGKTNKDVIMQLDIGHAQRAGSNPIDVMKKYPGRAVTVHVKEFSPSDKNALIGEGQINWKGFFQAAQIMGGTEWYIIEEESGAYPGLEGIEKSIKNLKKLLS